MKTLAGNLQKGLEETKRAADAATKSASMSEMALKLTQRADLLLDTASIAGPSGQFPGVVPSSRVVVQFKNYGPTRADNVVFGVNLDIPEVPNAEQSLGPGVLGPGDSQTISFARFGSFLTETTSNDINTGKSIMRIRGTVTYLDVFGESHELSVNSRYSARNRIFRAQEQ